MKIAKSDKERFYEKFKINKKTGCWVWRTGRHLKSYPSFTCTIGDVRKVNIASRYSYLLYFGSLDEKLLVCHTCDNPRCVNPDHLFLGTQKDNIKDMYDKNRCNRTKGIFMNVNIIKELLKKSKLSARKFSKELGFPENALSYYINGKRNPNILNCYRIMAYAKKHYGMEISLEQLLPKE